MKTSNTNFYKFHVLTTERLFLRNFTKKDTADFYKIRSDRIVTENAGIKRHSSPDETKKLINDIEASFKKGTGISWALWLKDKNILIGYTGIWKITKEHFKGEIGYALNSAYFGKGYMAEALQAIIEFAFNKLKLHRLEANIDAKNTSSIKLLKKLKFKQEAFLREDYFFNGIFQNSVILSKLENEIN